MTKIFLVIFVSIKTPFLIALQTKRVATVIGNAATAPYAITNFIFC